MQKSPFILDEFPSEMDAAQRNLRGKKILFDGNFKGDYSLAIVNRELGKALKNLGIQCDFYAHDSDWHNDPAIAAEPVIRANLLPTSPNSASYDFHIRNTWPPRADDMRAKFNAYVCFAWEETELPANIVAHFNRHLDAILVTAKFVREAMILSGVTIPILVIGNGCDHLQPKSSAPTAKSIQERFTRKPIRFLHISSCFPRKGADLLVDAFHDEFGDDPNWELLIKTFPNPHNTIVEKVASKGNPKNIKIINKSVAPEEIFALYRDAVALVAPSKGEGFGLPFAEAMLCGLPVVTTGFSGQTDFCTPETAWLIDFILAPSHAHVSGPNSLWAIPSAADLRKKLREAGTNSAEALKKAASGYALVNEYFTWKKVARRCLLALFNPNLDVMKKPSAKIDLVSTWQQVCGIATYSEHLYNTKAFSGNLGHIFGRRLEGDELPFAGKSLENVTVTRPWGYTGAEIQVLCSVIENQSNSGTIWIQHHPGFFSASDGARIIQAIQKSKYKKKLITLHNVKEIDFKQSDWLSKFDAIFVHTADDAARLSTAALKNVYVIPHGILNIPRDVSVKNKSSFTVGTFGFLYPHKKVLNLIAAIAIAKEYIPEIQLKLLTAAKGDHASQLERARISTYINQHNMNTCVDFNPAFLDEDQVLHELSTCDLLAFPYDESTESATGAGRIAIAAKRPLLISNSSVLRDLREFSHVLKSNSPQHIAETIIQLHNNNDLLNFHTQARLEYLALNDYESIASRYLSVIEELAN